MKNEQETGDYRLDLQVGYLLRRATQRHLSIFSQHIPQLTSTQFAALAKLCELGPTSQNALGRATSMDAATIKGVADRLRAKGLLVSTPDPDDRRRIHLTPTDQGRALYEATFPKAHRVTLDTLEPLTPEERTQLLDLLLKLT
ncbi:MarR family winged helix-turn-helix transcriptional regulator [Pseudooceanicola sp. 502str34]